LLENSAWQQGGLVFRKAAALMIVILAVYLIVQPFLSA
jgi:hypothetical protein